MELELSYNTWYLLAQHLHWINNGYDATKLNELIKIIKSENLPFCPTRLYQIEEKLGNPTSIYFNPEELEKLNYFYPCLANLADDLSFFRYCTNLEEVDFSCTDIEDIYYFKYLNNLTHIDLSYTKINSIEALASLPNIEWLNLESCNVVSLLPLQQHKKIMEIVLENVENEDEILNIISNQKTCSASYLVKNNKELYGLTFPRHLVIIDLEEELLKISMISIVTDKHSAFFEIPTELIYDEHFVKAYRELLEAELDKRVRSILKTNYEIVESSKYYTSEEIDFGTEVKIRRIVN